MSYGPLQQKYVHPMLMNLALVVYICVCVNMFLPFFKAYAANFFELTAVQQLR